MLKRKEQKKGERRKTRKRGQGEKGERWELGGC
jgi:hypothetical protein